MTPLPANQRTDAERLRGNVEAGLRLLAKSDKWVYRRAAEVGMEDLDALTARVAELEHERTTVMAIAKNYEAETTKRAWVVAYHVLAALAGETDTADPPCPGCGMTSQVEPSRSEPGRWMCHGCARTFGGETEDTDE